MVFLRRTRHLVPILILFFAACAIAQSEPPQVTPSQTKDPNNQSAPTDRSTNPTPDPTVVVQTFNEPPPTGPSDEESEHSLRDLGWKLLDPMVLVTIAIAGFTLWLAKLTKQQSIAYKTVERGWVSLAALDIMDGPQLGVPRSIRVALHNSGKTPVTIADANITVRSGTLPDVQPRALPIYDPCDVDTPSVLVGNETSAMYFNLTIKAKQNTHVDALASLVPGTNADIWIYGFVHYTTSLDPQIVRHYGWARQYDQIKVQLFMQQFPKEPPTIKFRHENKAGYNYAD